MKASITRFVSILLTLACFASLLTACDLNFGGNQATTDGSGGAYDPNAKPYDFTFASNGDGTCKIVGVTFDQNHQSSFCLTFPETSPDGDRVTVIDYQVMCAVPHWITVEDFERTIDEPLQEAVRSGLLGGDTDPGRNFYYKRFLCFFILHDASRETDPARREEMYREYPITAEAPIYTFVQDANEIELCMMGMYMQLIGYTADQAYQADVRCGYAPAVTPQNAVVYPSTIVEIVFPDAVEYVNPSVYQRCNSLERLTLPACVTSVSECDLVYKSHLTTLSMVGVKTLPEYWNEGCSSLKEILLSASLEKVALESRLTTAGEELVVRYDGTLEQWEQVEKTIRADGQRPLRIICTNGELVIKRPT